MKKKKKKINFSIPYSNQCSVLPWISRQFFRQFVRNQWGSILINILKGKLTIETIHDVETSCNVFIVPWFSFEKFVDLRFDCWRKHQLKNLFIAVAKLIYKTTPLPTQHHSLTPLPWPNLDVDTFPTYPAKRAYFGTSGGWDRKDDRQICLEVSFLDMQITLKIFWFNTVNFTLKLVGACHL